MLKVLLLGAADRVRDVERGSRGVDGNAQSGASRLATTRLPEGDRQGVSPVPMDRGASSCPRPVATGRAPSERHASSLK